MKTPRVLVIDENAEIALLEHAMFEMHRYNVDVTVHADEALRKLATRCYDVLVLGAPIVVNGRFFLDIVADEFQSLAPCTIIVTSQFHDPELINRCLRTNVYAVIAKPFEVEELSTVVAECVANHCQPAPTRWIGIPKSALPQSERPRD